MKNREIYSPIWPAKIVRIKLANNKARFSDDGREKWCSRCEEFSPADTEFFPIAKNTADGLGSFCRCCNAEIQNENQYWRKAS